jgi:hypothetical protein
MFSTLVRMLGLLYQVTGELLCRGLHGITGKCHDLGEKNAIWKFPNHTSYSFPLINKIPTFLRYFSHM